MGNYDAVLMVTMSVLSIVGICMIVINFWLDFRENK